MRVERRFCVVGSSEIILEGADRSGIPLTASPDGATSRGTIDAKDERRRSDAQNMKAVGLKVRVNQCMESNVFVEKNDCLSLRSLKFEVGKCIAPASRMSLCSQSSSFPTNPSEQIADVGQTEGQFIDSYLYRYLHFSSTIYCSSTCRPKKISLIKECWQPREHPRYPAFGQQSSSSRSITRTSTLSTFLRDEHVSPAIKMQDVFLDVLLSTRGVIQR
jgi:hypothetical protein